MQIIPLGNPRRRPLVQARFRNPPRRFGIFNIARELVGLAGLLGGLGVAFYAITQLATRIG